MMHYSFRSPVESAAIGNVDREIRQKREEARRLGELRRQGRLSPEAEAEARRRFRGIFKRILDEALGE